MRFLMMIIDRLLGKSVETTKADPSTELARQKIEERREFVLRRLHKASSNIQATAHDAVKDARRSHYG